MVDGLGVGDVSHVVLRERQTMAEEGMIVVIVTIDEKRGEIVGSPDIISRGFIFMKDNQELIAKVRAKVRNITKTADPKKTSYEIDLKDRIRNDVGQLLYSHTRRRPMVLPVLIEV